MLEYCGEVIEDVLFMGQHAGLVPFFTEFAAAAQIRHGDNKTMIEQNSPRGDKARLQADAVPTVARDQAWVRPVQLSALRDQDAYRNFRPITTHGKFAHDLHVGEIDHRRRGEREFDHFLGLWAVSVPGGRLGEGAGSKDYIVRTRPDQPTD